MTIHASFAPRKIVKRRIFDAFGEVARAITRSKMGLISVEVKLECYCQQGSFKQRHSSTLPFLV
jgi:hypothetical protein